MVTLMAMFSFSVCSRGSSWSTMRGVQQWIPVLFTCVGSCAGCAMRGVAIITSITEARHRRKLVRVRGQCSRSLKDQEDQGNAKESHYERQPTVLPMIENSIKSTERGVRSTYSSPI